jgi:nicotinamide riboside kinase
MKIVISGTYSTGKTLTSIALSSLTGIPVTHARTMRELLVSNLPGRKLEKCNFSELIELGTRRFSERIIAEKGMKGSFITDGCPLQEWLYGTTRIMTGLNPSEKSWKINVHKVIFSKEWDVFEDMLYGIGTVAKEYTKNNYDKFVHLPIEFPFDPDGHRPTSEKFRKKSEELLMQTYEELGLNVLSVSGNIEERLQKITEGYRFNLQMPIKKAIEIAYKIKKEKFDNTRLEMS